MNEKRATLEEKLIGMCGWDMAQNIRDMLADHFQLGELELNVGDIKIKSDNTPENTIITVGGKGCPLSVLSIMWYLKAEERGQLTLNLM